MERRRIENAHGRLSRRVLLAAGASLAALATTLAARAQEGGRAEASQTGNSSMEIDMTDKIVLVTGSTDGLGRAVANALGSLGATVLIHGRNAERGAATVREVEAAGGRAEFLRADLASLDEVRRLGDEILARYDRLDVLINNAGIWTDGSDERRVSVDGHELVFAVNYLAGYLLTLRLLPLLRRSERARIVNVSSLAQQPLDFENVMLEHEFSASRAYGQSKLAQVMFTIDLARALEGSGITVNSLHPATLMDTAMVEKAGATPRSTVAEGTEAVMRLAVSPELQEQSGLFFNGERETRANDQAYDEQARARLRTLSQELTGERFG